MNHDVDFQSHRARLSGMEVSDAYLAGLDLRRTVAQSSSWLGCTFKNVRFASAALGNALFDRCNFENCDFRGAVLVSRIYRSTFKSCDFDTASFQGAHLLKSSLDGRAQFSTWDSATIEECRINLDLRGADLNFCTSRDVDFRGSSLWSARIPMNCAFFSTNVFDERQLGLLLALFLDSNSDIDLKMMVDDVPGMERWKRLYKRIAQPRARRELIQ